MSNGRRPHPSWCRHCKMVQEYRDQRSAELDAYYNPKGFDDGFRDPHAWGRIITFKRWLQTYKYEDAYYREKDAEMSSPLDWQPYPIDDRNAGDYPPDTNELEDHGTDTVIERWKIVMLNRIDDPGGCTEWVWGCGPLHKLRQSQCGIPEWEVFSNRCYDHSPGIGYQ